MSFVYPIPCIFKPRVTGSNPVGRANKSRVFKNFRKTKLYLSSRCPVIVLFDPLNFYNFTGLTYPKFFAKI